MYHIKIKQVSMKAKFIFISILYLFFQSCSSNTNQEKISSEYSFEKIIGNKIYFRNGHQLQLDLYNINYIGLLNQNTDAPFIIVSGNTCSECDENKKIFIIQVTNSVSSITKYKKYTYPGWFVDYETGDTLFEANMHFGKCLDSISDCVIYNQEEHFSNGSKKSSLYIIEPIGDSLHEKTVSDISLFTRNTNANCTEVKGIEFTSEP